MRIIYNSLIPFKGFAAINLFGVLFVRNGVAVTDRMLNHERIHTAQMREMLYVFFYLWYVAEWLVRIITAMTGHGITGLSAAYHSISFEREAYMNEKYINYLENRELLKWIEYL